MAGEEREAADERRGASGDAELSRARNIGLGCFSTFVGFWSGGMVGVLVGRVVGSARNCMPPEGLPACDWYWYAAVGMIIGATTLPVLVLRRLRRREAARTST
jgi:hypothetical protein